MRSTLWLSAIIFLFNLITLPELPSAAGFNCEKLVLAGSYHLSENETLDGNLCLLGAVGTIEKGSLVDGNTLLLGGTLLVNGKIAGDVYSAGGVVDLANDSVIGGDLTILGGEVFGVDQATINGEIRRNFGFPNTTPISTRNLPAPTGFFQSLWNLFWLPIRSLLWTGLALLVFILLPKALDRVGKTVQTHLLVSTGIGLGTLAAGLLVMGMLAITIICIPFSFLIACATGAAWVLGILGIGAVLGEKMGQVFKQNWKPMLSLAIGIFTLTFIVNSIDLVLPFVGWLPKSLVGITGLGAVVLTRFGTKNYPQFLL